MRIVICGSMTAAKEMIASRDKLIALGHEVILPELTESYASMETLDQMHSESSKNKVAYDLIKSYFDKIKDSDSILVVNIERKGIEGYIGGNSFLEMGFAFVLGKKIYLLNQIPDISYQDELKAMNPVVIANEFSQIV